MMHRYLKGRVLIGGVRYAHKASEASYIPTRDDLKQLKHDKKKYEVEYGKEDEEFIQKSLTNKTSNIESIDIKPLSGKSSRLNYFRMSKASDYIWALKENLKKNKVPESFINDKFPLLEKSMYSINDIEKSSLISIDLKTTNGNLKEIGIAIFDSNQNENSNIANILNQHILVEEHHGVLSTNNFHGESTVLPMKETKNYIESLLKLYFESNESSKLVGFHIPYVLKNLQEANIDTSIIKNYIDIYDLYSLPFAYNNILSRQMILGSSNFFQLETILKRLNLPSSFSINTGNSSYYQLLALISMTNPYHRIKFRLDNVLGNLDFMEKFFVDQLNLVMKQSEERIQNNIKNNSKLTIKAYNAWQKSNYINYDDHKSALLKTFRN